MRVRIHFLKKTQEFMLVDGVFHAVVEQDPPASADKFVKYSLPKIMLQISEKSKEEPTKE